MRARNRGSRRWIAASGCALIVTSGCLGRIGGSGETGASPGGHPEGPVDPDAISVSGLRRLTVSEYYNTAADLLGDTDLPVFEILPADRPTPFDNDYSGQVASQGLIDAADFIAERASDQLLADPGRRDDIVGCVPSDPGDEACMRSFVSSFGRRAMRHTLTNEEVDEYVLGFDGSDGALAYALEAKDFYFGVHYVVWSMLQDPAFLYRIEIGTPIEGQPGLFRLTGVEVASRMSYLIWGSMPDDALLDRAEAGGLETADDRKEAALALLQDERAKKRITRFHSMWLGFDQLPIGGQLGADMREETKALISRVVFEEKLPWQSLFTFDETYVTSLLADQYGLTPPATPEGAWVPYAGTPGGEGRAGILSHGTFLSNGAKFDDTSPVKRGLIIRERLLCQDIADPPPNVDVDAVVQPPDAVCKRERFAAHRQGGCATCHDLMDPVGFGLEQYDQFGAFRTYETDNPDTDADESQCAIDGKGELELGTFVGPAELGRLLTDSGVLSQCVTTQLYRFATGRAKLDDVDDHVVEAITKKLGGSDFTFDELVLELVSHPSFANRREE